LKAAIQGRGFALDVFRHDGSHVQALVDTALREHGRWSKAAFIGCCVLLRGCAKSVLDVLSTSGRQDKGEQSIGRFRSYLKHKGPGSDDFLVKYHCAVRDSPSCFSIGIFRLTWCSPLQQT